MADLEFASNLPEDRSSIQLTGEAQAKYERITRNLQEVTSPDVIKKVLQDGKTVKAYWGEFRLHTHAGADGKALPRPVVVSDSTVSGQGVD